MGMFESVSFAGGHYILGSWYKPSELGKRACLLTASQNLGSLFAGLMQGAIYTTMNGRLGLSGWRWLMVINCLMTAPIWILGFLTFPGEVANCDRWYLSESEKKLAVSRLPVHEATPLNWGVFRKVFGDWRFWAFAGQFCFNTQMEWAGLYSKFN
jgi:ACS family pantothenate transporter-like MFS transporter